MTKKGFGQSEPRKRDTRKFIEAFRKCASKTKGDEEQLQHFLHAKLAKLDESLLEPLPFVFKTLTANQSSEEREAIARLFGTFGTLIREFPHGDRSLNLELSITAYQLALKIFTGQEFPKEWAATQNNLANAYSERIRGERAENLEHAIAAYELALQVYTRSAFPEKWARTQHNLANAYRDRVRGEETENLKQAITLYKEASQVLTCEAYPYKWAENQGALAEALMKRASLSGDSSDLDAAITLLETALEVAVAGSPDFIDSQYRLGNALSRRYEHSQNPDDLQSALKAYKTALDAISIEHYDRKQIWQALPTTQSILGSRLIRDGQWQEGLQLLLNSVHQLRTGDDSLAHANALFQIGRAQEILLNKDEARLYYRDALRLYQYLQDSLGIAKSRYGLGSVFVSRGNLKKGMTELRAARKIYQDLGKLNKVTEIDDLYRDAEQVMEEQQALEKVYL